MLMAEGAREHLVPLGGEWDCWTILALRSTGFPFSWLLRLASSGATAVASALLEVERARDEQREAAAAEVSKRLDGTPRKVRRALTRLRDQLARGATPEAAPE